MKTLAIISSAFFVAASVAGCAQKTIEKKINADLRDEFNQHQTKQQKDNQSRDDYCSSLFARAQFKRQMSTPVVYYHIKNNQVLEIEELPDDRICDSRRLSDLGVAKTVVDADGEWGYTQTLYIEDEELILYEKHVYNGFSRKVIGEKK